MIQNPGRFTLQGTNTYLIGVSRPYILLDVGEGKPGYIRLLETVLLDNERSNAHVTSNDTPFVSDIIISHRHHDHHGGLPSVLTLLHKLGTTEAGGNPYVPPRIHKFPASPQISGVSPEPEQFTFESTLEAISRLSSSIFEQDPSFSSGSWPLVHTLSDKQVFHPTSDSSSTPVLSVVHTPGHTPDSTSLSLTSHQNVEGLPAFFTADTILGEGTTVFEDLGVYMRSLEILSTLASEVLLAPGITSNEVTLYPGHGPILTKGLKTIDTYITHRIERESQILALIPEQKRVSISEIVKTLYGSYPPSVWPAAEKGVWLHLQKLRDEGKVCPVELRAGSSVDEKDFVREALWTRC